jgi:hypothetical protein
MSEEHVAAALRALAEQDLDRQAPQEVEIRLLAAFRRRRSRSKLKTVALAGLAAAAAITMFFGIPREHRKPVVPAAVKQQPAPVAEVPAPEPTPVRAARPKREKPREIVTQFFPLLDVAPPFESGQLLRVTVPASTMREVGLPVNEDRLGDRVYADVLVGQEGLARAIRFVSYEQ